MARRSDHNKEELKELILHAAKYIVVKEGFSNLSARKIAKKIGYTVGTLYNLFKDLNELVLYLNAETLGALYEELVNETCNCKKAEEKIYKISLVYVNFALKNPNLWNMLYEFHYPRKEGEKLPQWFQSKLDKNFELLEEAFLNLIKNKVEAVKYSRLFWASLQGICNLSLAGKLATTSSGTTHSMVDLLVKMFLKVVK